MIVDPHILSARPQYATIEEMDSDLIHRWNAKVTRKDEIYILGDLSYRSPYDIGYYIERMQGRKHLIIGNHDTYWMKKVGDLSQYFESVAPLKIIKFDKKNVTLCHYPLLEWLTIR